MPGLSFTLEIEESVARRYWSAVAAEAAEAIVDAGHDKVGVAVNAVGGKYGGGGCSAEGRRGEWLFQFALR